MSDEIKPNPNFNFTNELNDAEALDEPNEVLILTKKVSDLLEEKALAESVLKDRIEELLARLDAVTQENAELKQNTAAIERQRDVFRAGFERAEKKLERAAQSTLREGKRPPFASFKKLTDEELAKQIESNG